MSDDAAPQDLPSDWIDRARAGDRQALGRLLDRYRPLLRARAQDSLGADLRVRVDESDVVQQACLSVQDAIAGFRGTSEPELVQWLLQIVEHAVLHVVERERNARKRAIDREVRGSGPLQQVADPQTSPSRRAMRGEQRRILDEAIRQLPDDQQAAVRLKYLEQATLAETARRLGKTEDAASGLLQRGIARLNRILKGQESDPS